MMMITQRKVVILVFHQGGGVVPLGQQATVIKGLLHTADHPLNMPVLVVSSNRANLI